MLIEVGREGTGGCYSVLELGCGGTGPTGVGWRRKQLGAGTEQALHASCTSLAPSPCLRGGLCLWASLSVLLGYLCLWEPLFFLFGPGWMLVTAHFTEEMIAGPGSPRKSVAADKSPDSMSTWPAVLPRLWAPPGKGAGPVFISSWSHEAFEKPRTPGLWYYREKLEPLG